MPTRADNKERIEDLESKVKILENVIITLAFKAGLSLDDVNQLKKTLGRDI